MHDTTALLIEKHQATCVYCSRPGTPTADPDGRPWTRDHRVPTSKHGPDTLQNQVLSCFHCNSSKGAQNAAAFSLRLSAGVNRAAASYVITHSSAARAVAYIHRKYWGTQAEIFTDKDSLAWWIEVRLPWPPDAVVRIEEFTREGVEKEMAVLYGISEAWWAPVNQGRLAG